MENITSLLFLSGNKAKKGQNYFSDKYGTRPQEFLTAGEISVNFKQAFEKGLLRIDLKVDPAAEFKSITRLSYRPDWKTTKKSTEGCGMVDRACLGAFYPAFPQGAWSCLQSGAVGTAPFSFVLGVNKKQQ